MTFNRFSDNLGGFMFGNPRLDNELFNDLVQKMLTTEFSSISETKILRLSREIDNMIRGKWPQVNSQTKIQKVLYGSHVTVYLENDLGVRDYQIQPEFQEPKMTKLGKFLFKLFGLVTKKYLDAYTEAFSVYEKKLLGFYQATKPVTFTSVDVKLETFVLKFDSYYHGFDTTVSPNTKVFLITLGYCAHNDTLYVLEEPTNDV